MSAVRSLSDICGNPASSMSPVALRPALASGLPLTLR
jgi:hypothetical protein